MKTVLKVQFTKKQKTLSLGGMTVPIKLYSKEELDQIADNWSVELAQAEAGEKTSLVFAKHQIQTIGGREEKGLVIVVGGSNLIVAEILRKDGVLEILSYEKSRLPVLETKEQLFGILTAKIPQEISKLALNFAYPLDPFSRGSFLDGVLIAPSKEHKLEGLVGRPVGQELEEFLQQNYARKVEIVVANDTVCLVLAGLSRSQPNSLAGGIVGTGFNFGLFIDQETVVNLESANFDKFEQTETGKKITEQSNNPNKGKYEKEISGAYLFEHYNILARDAGLEPVESTNDMNTIARSESKSAEIAQRLFNRSASLVAAQIAGIYRFKQTNQLSLVMEGSMFWNGWNYKNLVYDNLRDLDVTLNHLQVFKIERSYLLGAAELIL